MVRAMKEGGRDTERIKQTDKEGETRVELTQSERKWGRERGEVEE